MNLRDLTERLGGSFASGEDVTPADFGDVNGEVSAARSTAIVVDRSPRGKLLFKGEDCASFLHGMLTNTVEGMSQGMGNHTALTDVKGSVQADAWLYHCGDGLVMETEPGVQEKVKTFLDKYVIADDVEIVDWTSPCAIIGLQGPRASEILEKVSGAKPALEALGHTEVKIGDADVRLVNRSYTGEPGFDLWVANNAESVFQLLVDEGVAPAGTRALEILRIEAGIPRYGVDVDDRVVPLEAGLSETVDFTKGCFIGQEVLGKMNNIGKPRRYLVGVEVDTDTAPEMETELTSEGKVVGLTKSGIRSERLGKTICLASVRRGSEELGTKLTGPDGCTCEVVELPFS
jgi:folate-binding protein YgfZ